MSTTTNANKTGAAATESTEVAEVTAATEVTSGVTDMIGGPASPPKPPKPPKRRMAREPQAGAGRVESKADDGELAHSLTSRATSKIASVIALLDRAEGATLAEMVEATGWLPHTTRAALTGLKKKGHTITKDKRGDVTCYHIAKVG